MKRRVVRGARSVRAGAFAAVMGVSLLAGAIGCSRSDPTTETGVPVIVLDEAPKDIKPREIEFDGKVRVIGVKMNQGGVLRAGRRVSVTIYWQAKEKLEPGLKMLAALVDDAGERLVDLDDAGPLRELRDGKPAHPPDTWIPGKVYVDQLTFTVPKNVKTWRVKIVAGIAKGEEKLKATGSEPHDGLYLMATSGTGIKRGRDSSAPSEDAVPQVRLDRLDAKAKIKIDGKLDEEAWKESPQIKLVNIATGKFERKAALQGRARLLWSKDGLYVGFDVGDKDVVGGFKATDKDPHLWTKDTVEIMIDPDGDGDNQDYYEIQINPQNLVFDSHFDKYNEPKTEPDGPFGNQAWSSGVKSAVVVDGTLDKSDDKDGGYTVEALIPWKSLSKAKKTPPALGDTWRINLYAIQENSGVAWSPILGKGNLHFAPRFAKVLFAEKDWKPAEPVAAASSAAPSPATPDGVNAVVQAAKPPASAAPAAPAPPAPAAAPAAPAAAPASSK